MKSVKRSLFLIIVNRSLRGNLPGGFSVGRLHFRRVPRDLDCFEHSYVNAAGPGI